MGHGQNRAGRRHVEQGADLVGDQQVIDDSSEVIVRPSRREPRRCQLGPARTREDWRAQRNAVPPRPRPSSGSRPAYHFRRGAAAANGSCRSWWPRITAGLCDVASCVVDGTSRFEIPVVALDVFKDTIGFGSRPTTRPTGGRWTDVAADEVTHVRFGQVWVKTLITT